MPDFIEFSCPEDRSARRHWLQWYAIELETYVDKKFDDARNGHDADIAHNQLDEESFWVHQIFQYLDRLRLFRLDTLQGRQALAKMVMTSQGCLESAIRVFGSLPAPGVSSGEISEWKEAPPVLESERKLYSDRRNTRDA